MGNVVSQQDSRFRIEAGKLQQALEAVNAAYGSSYRSVAEALEEDRWSATVDHQTGDIIDVTFEGEKMYPGNFSHEDVLYHLAPFVQAGSYIEMSDEQHRRWRWLFDGQSVTIKFAQVSW